MTLFGRMYEEGYEFGWITLPLVPILWIMLLPFILFLAVKENK